MAEVMDALHNGQAKSPSATADFFYEQEHDTSAPMVVLADGYDAAPNIMNVLVSPTTRSPPRRPCRARPSARQSRR